MRSPAPAVADVLQAAVAAGTVPHAVVVTADLDGDRREFSAGSRSAGAADPVRGDQLFRLASMTKVVTAVAAVQLRDSGALDLEAPVERYRPEFAAVQVLVGFDEDRPRLRAPSRQATVRQLLDHTAGFGYDLWHPELVRWAGAGGPDVAPDGLSGTFAGPMLTDPGTAALYGIGYDWLALVIEAVSGQSLADYLSAHVFQPLGMIDTGFAPDARQRRRLVPVHVRGDTGAWIPTDVGWERRHEPCAGGHGLYSTPRDYLTFLQVLVGSGSVDGVTVLAPESVEELFADHTAGLAPLTPRRTTRPATTADFPVGVGVAPGWGLLVGAPDLRTPRGTGEGGWAGIFNTYFWVDRRRGVTGALFSQCLPFAAPPILRLRAEIENAVQLTTTVATRA